MTASRSLLTARGCAPATMCSANDPHFRCCLTLRLSGGTPDDCAPAVLCGFGIVSQAIPLAIDMAVETTGWHGARVFLSGRRLDQVSAAHQPSPAGRWRAQNAAPRRRWCVTGSLRLPDALCSQACTSAPVRAARARTGLGEKKPYRLYGKAASRVPMPSLLQAGFQYREETST